MKSLLVVCLTTISPAVAQQLDAGVDNANAPQPEPVFFEPVDLIAERREFAGEGNPASPAAPQLLRRSRDPRNLRVRPASPVGELQADGSITPLANTKIAPLQGTAARPEVDPFAALGIRLGTFRLFPVLTQTFGTTDNIDGSNPGNQASFSTTDLQATLVSDWALHELRAEIGGSYQTFFNGTIDDLPTFDGNMALRIDARRDLTFRVGGAFDVERQNSNTAFVETQSLGDVSSDGQEVTVSAFAEVEKQTSAVGLRLRGTITNTETQQSAASIGADVSDTLAEVTARLTYGPTQAISPFVEAGFGIRTFEGVAGVGDDSSLYSLRGGLQFDRGEKLNGEVSVGYATEQFGSSVTSDLEAFTLDGTINWSPQSLTTITATAQTGFDVATSSLDVNSTIYVAGLSITQNLRPNLSVNARVLGSLRVFEGDNREDKTFQTQIGAEWALNRYAAWFATLGYENIESTDAGSSSDATTAQIGFRLRR